MFVAVHFTGDGLGTADKAANDPVILLTVTEGNAEAARDRRIQRQDFYGAADARHNQLRQKADAEIVLDHGDNGAVREVGVANAGLVLSEIAAEQRENIHVKSVRRHQKLLIGKLGNREAAEMEDDLKKEGYMPAEPIAEEKAEEEKAEEE